MAGLLTVKVLSIKREPAGMARSELGKGASKSRTLEAAADSQRAKENRGTLKKVPSKGLPMLEQFSSISEFQGQEEMAATGRAEKV